MPDGRILVAEQTGALEVLKDGRPLRAPMLDLSERVDSHWERGLLGVAVHPDFPHTPHLYVLYVAARPYPHHVLSRFVIVGDTAQLESEHVLLEGDDQSRHGGKRADGHQGGPLRFGPDGKLYVAIGEPPFAKPADCASQKLDMLQGKILRLDADGRIPADNPFFAQTTGKYRAIWAIGLRNPYGLAFQPETGRLFETDVGQSSWEEVNEIVRGGNYGWPDAEGMSTNAAFRNPLHAYAPVVGRSIVGGTFYPRVSAATSTAGFFPQKWRGRFFFADWAAHWVKALDPEKPEDVVTFAKGLNAPVALEVEPDGSLLVLNRGTIWRDGEKFKANTGSLVRIRHVGESGIAARTEPPPFPKLLSEAGVFASLDDLRANSGFLEFEISAPPWQPGVRGRRWISLPEGKAITVSENGAWEYPAGAVIVQHYALESTGAPFETHVMWLTGPRLARAAAYRWKHDAREAVLVEETEVVPLPGDPKRRWLAPGTEQQLNLDFAVCGFVLPVNGPQVNRNGQIEAWNARGWFAPALSEAQIPAVPRLAALDDETAPLELRVRSYLDVNCSICHRPGGPSRGFFDARIATPLEDQKLLGGDLMAGDLGVPGARVVRPGRPELSVLLMRLQRNDAFRMPQVSVNDEPQPVLPVLEAWIRSLPDAAQAGSEK
jgi:glucose/arabinose dehydrogenase